MVGCGQCLQSILVTVLTCFDVGLSCIVRLVARHARRMPVASPLDAWRFRHHLPVHVTRGTAPESFALSLVREMAVRAHRGRASRHSRVCLHAAVLRAHRRMTAGAIGRSNARAVLTVQVVAARAGDLRGRMVRMAVRLAGAMAIDARLRLRFASKDVARQTIGLGDRIPDVRIRGRLGVAISLRARGGARRLVESPLVAAVADDLLLADVQCMHRCVACGLPRLRYELDRRAWRRARRPQHEAHEEQRKEHEREGSGDPASPHRLHGA